MRSVAGAALAVLGAVIVASCGGGSDEPSFKATPVVIGTGLEPEQGAAAADGRLWFAAGDNIAGVDARTRKLVTKPRRVATGAKKTELYDLAAGDGGVWAAAKDGGDVVVSRVDKPRGKRIPLKDIEPMSVNDPSALVRLAVGEGRVWAAAYDETFMLIVDPATGKQVTANSATIEDIAVGGGHGWLITEEEEAGSQGGSLDRVDPRTGDLKSFTVGDSPIAVAYGAGSAWVLFRDSVKRYDASGREVASIDLEGVEGSVGDIAVGGDTVWVVSGSDQRALRIDARSNKLDGDPLSLPVDTPIDLLAAGDSAWVTADGSRPTVIATSAKR